MNDKDLNPRHVRFLHSQLENLHLVFDGLIDCDWCPLETLCDDELFPMPCSVIGDCLRYIENNFGEII